MKVNKEELIKILSQMIYNDTLLFEVEADHDFDKEKLELHHIEVSPQSKLVFVRK